MCVYGKVKVHKMSIQGVGPLFLYCHEGPRSLQVCPLPDLLSVDPFRTVLGGHFPQKLARSRILRGHLC